MSQQYPNTKPPVPCRYCKHEIPKGIRRCPYCGIVNPTVTPKEVMVWTIGVIAVIYMLGAVAKALG